MDVDDLAREPLEKRLRQELHEAGADDERDAVPLEPVGERPVALLPRRVGLERERLRGDACRSGPLERAGARTAGGHRDHRQPFVDQRLEIRPLPGN